MKFYIKKPILSALFSAVMLLTPFASFANTVDRVVAVVNNDVITQQDLDKRFQYVLRQNQFNINSAQQRVLYRQVLNELVNEKVQKQFAQRSNIRVSDDEVKLAIAEFERKNNLSRGSFFTLANGIEDTAKAKVQADLTWQKVIQRHVRPRIIISPSEVNRIIDDLVDSAELHEKEIRHIFIAAEEGNENAKEAIFDLYEQVEENPSNFTSMAKAYTESDGYLGWFAEGELSPALEATVQKMVKGDISTPIQSSLGWHIIKVEDVRFTKEFETEPFKEYKVHILSLSVPSLSDSSPSLSQKETLQNAAENFETLGDMEEFFLQNKNKMKLEKVEKNDWIKEEELPKKSFKNNALAGSFSEIVKGDDTLSIYYIEDVREQLPEELRTYRERLTNRLTKNRTNLMSRRFMRDLRRAAFVEVRL